jgi:hypothetical protein
MATAPAGGPAADIIIAASFSVLSLLPAVLLHISLQARPRMLWITGYAVSAIAVALHIGDLVTVAPRFHYAAILLVTIGFTALTTASIVHEALSGLHDGAGRRLAGAMVLFLFAMPKRGRAKRPCTTREFRWPCSFCSRTTAFSCSTPSSAFS